MNPLKYFIEKESEDSVRADPHEGTSWIRRGEGAVLSCEIDGEFKPVPITFTGPMRFRADSNLNVNVFCLYALCHIGSGISIDPRNRGFGDTFVMLNNFFEFMSRVEAAVEAAAIKAGQEFKAEFVKYIDDTYEGEVGVFKKPSSFAYQNEFRIALFPGEGKAVPFSVGDLSDIVTLYPVSNLPDHFSVTTDERGRDTLRPIMGS